MTKVVAPCFSLEAKGMIGNAISYFSNSWGSVVGYYRQNQGARSRAFSELQKKSQQVFADAVDYWKALTPTERWLWEQYAKGRPSSGRCLYTKTFLLNKGIWSEFYPYPPKLWKEIVTNKVVVYDQTMADFVTLTGVAIAYKPEVIATNTHPPTWHAITALSGLFFIVRTEDFAADGLYYRVGTVANELTHCTLISKGYGFYEHLIAHSDMSTEIDIRIEAGDLVPLYTYKGFTMQQIIDGDLF